MQQVSRHAALQNDQDVPVVSQSAEQEPSKEHVLFLQGPVGPFFSRIAEDLSQRGFIVHKINFNGGDKLFYRHSKAVDYVGSPEEWPDYLKVFIKKKQISRIYVFGDCRYYHREARKLARQLAIDFFVFEEGYIRPNNITLERDGVNGFSTLMNQPALVGVRAQEANIEQSSGRFGFLLSAVFAMMYYMASSFYKSCFPDYSHHRPLSCLSEGATWIRSGYKKLVHLNSGKRIVKTLKRQFQNQYFLCPLQVHCDMQVVEHSEFESIEHFICEVISSFAKHAPCDHALVLKHHPLDRGYTKLQYFDL